MNKILLRQFGSKPRLNGSLDNHPLDTRKVDVQDASTSKAEASSVRSAPPEAPRSVESHYPLGYFDANAPAAGFSCLAAKAPFAACSMR